MASTILIKKAGPEPFSKKASAATPGGTQVPENAPLMAITRIEGNWLRTLGEKFIARHARHVEVRENNVRESRAGSPTVPRCRPRQIEHNIRVRKRAGQISSNRDFIVNNEELHSGIGHRSPFRQNRQSARPSIPVYCSTFRSIVLTLAAFWSTSQEELPLPEEFAGLGSRAQAIGRVRRRLRAIYAPGCGRYN